jgi:hypothetical protein
MDAWDTSRSELTAALRETEGPAGSFRRYLALSDTLARTYTVDRTLQGMWVDVPPDLREDASIRADLQAVRAIEHNTEVLSRFGRNYDPTSDSSFEAYFQRRRDARPYPHWSGHILSGSLQEGFFNGLRWIRGQITYRGVIDPIELWQYEDGVAPRWKWKDATAVTTRLSSNRDQRKQYERFQAGRDVEGQLSNLLEVFWEVKWSLRKLLIRAERRRPYGDRVSPRNHWHGVFP